MKTPHPLNFFDADCVIGPANAPLLPAGRDGTAASLLAAMDELGIAEACVASALSAEYDILEGHRVLLEETRPHPRLHPVWDVAAHHTGEFPEPDRLLERMKEHRISMARLLLHATNGYLDTLYLPVYEALFDRLAGQRCPLRLDYTTFNERDIPALRDVLRTWPSLPVIVTFPKLAHEERLLYFLWEHHANLSITLSGYQLLGGIEAIVKRFGARVLIYGSHYPAFTPLQSMMQVIYSEIGEPDKRLIAGDNLRTLLRHPLCDQEPT